MAFADPRLDFVYRPSINNGMIYESRAFIPIISTKTALLFSDIRGVSNFDTANEFNLGIGGRNYFDGLDVVAGAYYFYDYRKQTDIYKQHTAGVEVLGSFYEIRGNYYSPIGNSEGFLQIGQDDIGMVTLDRVKKFAIGGYDAEVGFKIPIGDKELWAYGSIYKFSGEFADSDVIQGKKARLEFDFANSLPMGLTANIGAEYDYSDDKDARGASVTFRVGVPLSAIGIPSVGLPIGSSKDHQYKHDRRMMKSIVRDVDVRVKDQVTKEQASATVTMSDGSKASFDELIMVTNEAELIAALAGGEVGTTRAIIINNDMTIWDEFTLGSHQKIISNNMEASYLGSDTGDEMKVAVDPDKAVMKIIGVYDFNSIGNLAIASLYDSLDYVSTEDELRTACAKPNNIVVLTGDISLSTTAVVCASNVVVISNGEGVSDYKAIKPDNVNTIGFDNVHTISQFIATFIGDNLIIDGLKVKSERYIKLYPNNPEDEENVFEVKNSIFESNSHYTFMCGDRLYQRYKFSDVKVTKSSRSGFATLWNYTYHQSSLELKNIDAEIMTSLASNNDLFTFWTVSIDGYFKIKHAVTDRVPVWTRNPSVNHTAFVLSFAEGTLITLEDTVRNTNSSYKVTKDVVIGGLGKLSPLSNKKIDSDLSDTSITGLEAGDIIKIS